MRGRRNRRPSDEGAPVRHVAVVFWLYLALIFVGIVLYTIVGAIHN